MPPTGGTKKCRKTLCIGFADIMSLLSANVMYLLTQAFYDKIILMKKDKLSDLSLELVKHCVFISYKLKNEREYNFADQIKRSSTSVCANIAEAGHPQSKKDMISKFEIALKEAFETGKWLEMLVSTNKIQQDDYNQASKICTKIRVLLIASIKTLKSNL